MMNAITEIFSSEWLNALGWTLLHSLWQALIILGCVLAAQRLIPSVHSELRYGIACIGLAFLMLASAATFLHLAPLSSSAENVGNPSTTLFHVTSLEKSPAVEPANFVPVFLSTIERNMPLIVIAWAVGFLFLVLRLATGIWFTYKIRSAAHVIEGRWQKFVRESARQLGITRLIELAESASITTPMVIGFLKPVILVPAGMLTGLTTSQLETILLHELAHIKRRDFLVNFLQTVFETVFFFNPFVWILSNEIRKEREYCCDDLVMKRHGDAMAYAHALVRLAEARLASPVLALPLSNDRNVLLQRVKRIMEKSFKRSERKRIVIPAILLIVSLASVSWMAAEKKDDNAERPLQDTVRRDTLNGARYSKRTIITIDENGLPHEEIVEEFEGDEDLRALLDENFPPVFDSAFHSTIPDFPPHPSGEMPVPGMDTIPPFHRHTWDSLSEAFSEQFKRQFDELTLKNDEFRMLFEQMQEKFFENEEDWHIPPHPNFPDDETKLFLDSGAFHQLEEQLKRLDEFDMHSLEDFGNAFKSFGTPSHDENALREELIRDGYLSPDEPIESLEWNDDSFKVNGTEVRPEDFKKYDQLAERMFRGEGRLKAQ